MDNLPEGKRKAELGLSNNKDISSVRLKIEQIQLVSGG